MRVPAVAATTVMLALTACGPASTTPSSQASSNPTAPQISPVGDATSAAPAMGLTCRLPVFDWGWMTNDGGSRVEGDNGFVSLPAGTFARDTSGVMVQDQTTLAISTLQAPTLHGDNSSGSFDAAERRWLPADRSHVLPDGSAYVYEVEHQDGSGYDIRLVDVATARDTLIYHMPYENAYQVLAFEPGTVYVYPILHRSGISGGLWRLDVATQKLSAVANAMDTSWQLVRSGVAWGGPAGTASDSLYRLDLASGVLTRWFQHPVQGAVFEGFGYGVSVIGFDSAGHPLVQVYPPPLNATSPQTPPLTPEVWIVNAPGKATQVTGLPIPQNGLGGGVTDAHGLWIMGGDGLYLYSESGFERVAPLPPPPAPNYALEGPCA